MIKNIIKYISSEVSAPQVVKPLLQDHALPLSHSTPNRHPTNYPSTFVFPCPLLPCLQPPNSGESKVKNIDKDLAVTNPRHNSVRPNARTIKKPAVGDFDSLRVEFDTATILTEEILNRFTISDSMDLHKYDDCNESLKLATGTYPLVAAALAKIQVKNKGTLDSTERPP